MSADLLTAAAVHPGGADNDSHLRTFMPDRPFGGLTHNMTGNLPGLGGPAGITWQPLSRPAANTS